MRNQRSLRKGQRELSWVGSYPVHEKTDSLLLSTAFQCIGRRTWTSCSYACLRDNSIPNESKTSQSQHRKSEKSRRYQWCLLPRWRSTEESWIVRWSWKTMVGWLLVVLMTWVRRHGHKDFGSWSRRCSHPRQWWRMDLSHRRLRSLVHSDTKTTAVWSWSAIRTEPFWNITARRVTNRWQLLESFQTGNFLHSFMCFCLCLCL